MVLGALRSWFDTPARRRRGEDKIVIPGVLDEVFGKDIDEPDGMEIVRRDVLVFGSPKAN